jgi:hypothetical protein
MSLAVQPQKGNVTQEDDEKLKIHFAKHMAVMMDNVAAANMVDEYFSQTLRYSHLQCFSVYERRVMD